MRDLAIVQLAQIVPQHPDLACRGVIHRGDQVQQGRFARTRWAHQGHELALLNVDIDFFQRSHAELVANEFLSQVARRDYRFTHTWIAYFTAILSPSFKSGGGLTMRSSPPTSPSSMRVP